MRLCSESKSACSQACIPYRSVNSIKTREKERERQREKKRGRDKERKRENGREREGDRERRVGKARKRRKEGALTRPRPVQHVMQHKEMR